MIRKIYLLGAFFAISMLFVSFNICNAATNYFVSVSGNDSNDGKSLAAPVKTIQKAADLMDVGDICYIREGTYRETLTVKLNDQTFQNYNGENVTISGADMIPSDTTWTNSSSYYNTNQAISMTLSVGNQLFYNGEMMNEARWPDNTGTLLQPVLATVDAVGTDGVGSYFVDTAITDFTSLVGTRLWVIANPSYWAQETNITAVDSANHKVYYNKTKIGSGFAVTAGDTYYLSGSIGYMNAQKEWFLDANSKLSLYIPGGGIPDNSKLEYKKRKLGIVLDSRSGTLIKGIKLFAANISTNGYSVNNVIDSITAKYVWHTKTPVSQQYNGILLYGSNNTLKNSMIQYSSGSIISFSGSGHKVINCQLQYGNYEAGNAAIMDGWGTNILISNNTISESGRACLQLNIQNSQIQYNDIFNAVWLTKDCGVIYAGNTDGQNTRIHHNKVHDNKASHVGEGIYFDSYSSGYIIDHNVVWNCYSGIRLNTPSNYILVYNNTVDYCSYRSLAYYGTSYTEDMFGDRVFNNIFRGNIQMADIVAYGKNIYSISDPQFVNELGLDFHLQANSPAINAGIAFAGITNNYLGNAPDCGAYEYGDTDWIAGCSLPNLLSSEPSFTNPMAPYMNLALNGGFEKGNLTSWSVASGTVVANNSAAWGNPSSKSRSNNYAAKLGSGAATVQQTIIGLTPDTWYTFSTWLLADSGEAAKIGVKDFGNQTVEIDGLNNNSYTQYTLNFKTGLSSTSATIYVSKTSTGTSGYVYCDSTGVTTMEAVVPVSTKEDIKYNFDFEMAAASQDGTIASASLDPFNTAFFAYDNASNYQTKFFINSTEEPNKKVLEMRYPGDTSLLHFLQCDRMNIKNITDTLIVEAKVKYKEAKDNYLRLELYPYQSDGVTVDTSVAYVNNTPATNSGHGLDDKTNLDSWVYYKWVISKADMTVKLYINDSLYSGYILNNISSKIWDYGLYRMRFYHKATGNLSDGTRRSVYIDYIKIYEPTIEIQELDFSDANNTPVTTLNAGIVSGSLKMNNNTAADSTATFLIALYQKINNALVLKKVLNYSGSSVLLPKNAVTDMQVNNIQMPAYSYDNTYEMKVFVWVDTAGMSPQDIPRSMSTTYLGNKIIK